MDVILFNPSTGYYNRALFNPLGLLSIGTFLKANGFGVRIVDRCIQRVNLKKLLDEEKPLVIGISLMSSRGLRDAVKISREAKKRGITVVWGGQLPTMQTDEVLKSGYVDYVSQGEGEYTWLEIMQAIKSGKIIENIHGLAYLKDGKVFMTECRPFADLADFPVSDFSLIDTPKYMQPYLGCKRMMYLYSAKGCPCRCAFCSNASFHKSTIRMRPFEKVIEEIKVLVENYGLDGVYFSDELFCLRQEQMMEFCDLIEKNDLHFYWGVQLRIGIIDDAGFRRMYETGCRWVIIGIETGSPEIMKRIHKNIDVSKIVPTFKVLNEIGITAVASFIIGYPNENAEQLRDTVKLIKRLNTTLIPVYHFTPLPGTELYNEVIENGTYKPPKTMRQMEKVVATESLGKNLSAVPDVDLKVIRCWVNWRALVSKNTLKSSRSYEFLKDTVLSGLHAISQKGVISFFVDGFSAAYELIYTLWYSHAYPKVLKKYGLKDDKKGA